MVVGCWLSVVGLSGKLQTLNPKPMKFSYRVGKTLPQQQTTNNHHKKYLRDIDPAGIFDWYIYFQQAEIRIRIYNLHLPSTDWT